MFETFQPTAIVHLAARTDLLGETLTDYEVNRRGVSNLCTCIAASKTVHRAIFTSSQRVCGVGYVPKTDTDYAASTVYGESKIAQEQIVWEMDGGGVDWCLTRPTTVWSPDMSDHYSMVLRLIEKGIFFHSGGGPLFKSYSYAENIAHQYKMLLTAPAENIHKSVFYLADYKPFSLRDYVNAIASQMGKRRPVTIPLPLARLLGVVGDGLNKMGLQFPFTSFRLNNIRTEYIFDLWNTEQVCGPVPVDFEEGVRRTVEWYSANTSNSQNGQT